MFRLPAHLGHNDLCSHATSKVDIDDISSTLNFLFQLPLARRSLNQLSRLRIHLVKEFKIGSIQFTHHMLLHDIATRAATQQRLSEQTPQRQRGCALALFSRRHDGLVHQIVFLCAKRYLVLKTEVSHSFFPDQNLFFFFF